MVGRGGGVAHSGAMGEVDWVAVLRGWHASTAEVRRQRRWRLAPLGYMSEKGRAREASESGESEQLGAPFLPLSMVSRAWLWRMVPCGG